MDDTLSLYYQNCRGVRTKLHTLFMNILSNSYDIIILTETWLHSDINDNEFIDSRYQVFRKDRDRVATGRQDGGGVLVAVLRSLCATARPSLITSALWDGAIPLPPVIDCVMLDLCIANFNYVIAAVYIPPKSSFDIYYALFTNLQGQLRDSNENFLLVGDFNLPGLHWDPTTFHWQPITNDTNPIHSCLRNFMSLHNCLQLNTITNKNGRTLDLCLTNDNNCSLSLVSAPLVNIDDLHPPFHVLFPVKTNKKNPQGLPHISYRFKNADYDQIIEDLENTNWMELFSDKDATQAISCFYEKLYNLIKKFVPTKVVNSGSYPCWFTPELIHIHKKKKRAWITMKKYNTQSNYNIFSLYRSKFKAAAERCYKHYLEKIEESIKINGKFFWTYIKNKKKTTDLPQILTYMDKIASTPEETCALFSNYFRSVFEPSSVTADLDIHNFNIDDSKAPDTQLSDITVSCEDVYRELKSLDITKGAGTDNIPPYFLKSTAKAIHEPLCFLFNKCLREGVFPRVWKCARIVPVHKGGPKKVVENYRPISILPTLSKVFERLVHDATYAFLRRIIIPQQHGFVKQRSTVTNMLIFTTFLFEGFEANKQTDCVYTDFRKAFDRVDHRILLEKLAFNGIRGNLWRWYRSYISNRTQKVVIKGCESEYVDISSGVPQGSIVGPLLFIIFINDISECFQNCNFLLYADDLKIYCRIDNIEDHIKFQEDLNRFSNYCYKNKLNLSIEKCKVITFTKKLKINIFPYSLCSTTLKRETSVKDLGITLDSKLHLDVHIENILNKAYRMYGFVARSGAEFSQPSTLLYLFKSLIRSQMEYAVSVWNPLYDKYINKLELVQKKFLRFIHYKYAKRRLPYQELLNEYKLLDLKSRRAQLEAMLLYDICQNKYDCIELTNELYFRVPSKPLMRSTRRNELFATKSCRTNAGRRCPINRMMLTHNRLFNDLDMFASTIGKYKNQVTDILNANKFT